MRASERVLGYSSGSIDARLMFIGEAPGRLGADAHQIPFHGDKSGHNFESLIEQVGINRYESFVTNAVLCNPKDKNGNNSPPTNEEIRNCSKFLKRQIELVDPAIVVTLGSTSLKATALLEKHSLALSTAVRKPSMWLNRILIPAYHPGQRAMLHRSFANQLADYQLIAERLRRLTKPTRKSHGTASSTKAAEIVEEMMRAEEVLSYFSIHKLLYLVETEAIKRTGRRISGSYIVRQKDGPYCVDLHLNKLRKALPLIQIRSQRGKLMLHRAPMDLFTVDALQTTLTDAEKEIIRSILQKYGSLTDSELKTRVYLTTEMKGILRLERNQKQNLFNAPLLGNRSQALDAKLD